MPMTLSHMEPERSPIERLKSNWFALALGGLLFLMVVAKYRGGVVRADGTDLAAPYNCSRAWLAGINPYDGQRLPAVFKDAGATDLYFVDPKIFPPIYPPITFVIMTPLALLSWDHAMRVWEIAALFLIPATLAALAHLAGLRWRDPRIILLLLFCLVFSPTRTAFSLSQNALPAICAAVFAVVALRHGRDMLAGGLLAIAFGFKFQDASFVFLYLLLIRRWRAAAWCAGFVAMLSLIAICRLGITQPGWIFDSLPWIRRSSLPGEIIDIFSTNANSVRFRMIHLPVLLSTILSSPRAVSIVNWLVCGPLILLAIVLTIRNSRLRQTPDLLPLSVLGALSLLPLYHRYPDAMILMIPMAWAIGSLGTPSERYARITLLLLLPFMFQPTEIIGSLIARGTVSTAVSRQWWWLCCVHASMIWMILLITCWLMFVLMRQTRSENESAAAAPGL